MTINDYNKIYLEIINEGIFSDSQQQIIKKLFFDCVNDNNINKEKQWNNNLKQKKISYWITGFKRIETYDLKQIMQNPKQIYKQIKSEYSFKPGTNMYNAVIHGCTGILSRKEAKKIYNLRCIHRSDTGNGNKNHILSEWFNDGMKCSYKFGQEENYQDYKWEKDQNFKASKNKNTNDKIDPENILRIFINADYDGSKIIEINNKRKEIKNSEIMGKAKTLYQEVLKQMEFKFIKKDQDVIYLKNIKHIKLKDFSKQFVSKCRHKIKISEDIGIIPIIEIPDNEHFKKQYDIQFNFKDANGRTELANDKDIKLAGNDEYKK